MLIKNLFSLFGGSYQTGRSDNASPDVIEEKESKVMAHLHSPQTLQVSPRTLQTPGISKIHKKKGGQTSYYQIFNLSCSCGPSRA